MSYVMSSNTKEVMSVLKQMLGPEAYIYTVPLTATATLNPGAPANQPVQASLSVQLGQNSVSNQQNIPIPATQIWFITDVYTTTSPTIDGYFQIYKNGVKMLETTPYLSMILASNPARATLAAPAKYSPQEVLSMNFIPVAPNTESTAVTETGVFTVVIADFTYTNIPPVQVAQIAQSI